MKNEREREREESPWLKIPAGDYEGHMGPEGVDQLAMLDTIFGQVYTEIRPARMLVLGCGTGNGFQHIDPAVSNSVVGLDLNDKYLEIARHRYHGLGGTLQLIESHAEKCRFDPGSFDMIHSALLLEYLEPATMIEKIAGWLVPGGVFSVVLQEPGDEPGPVTRTRFQNLQLLSEVMRLLSPEMLVRLARKNGLMERKSWGVPLKHGKTFHVGIFTRE